jgi:hypothetical protein
VHIHGADTLVQDLAHRARELRADLLRFIAHI